MTTNDLIVSRRAALKLLSASSAAVLLAACSKSTTSTGTSSSSSATGTSGNAGAGSGSSSTASSGVSAAGHVVGTSVITQVFGDGQKVAAVALRYDEAIVASSLSKAAFTVTGHTVTAVHTNTQAALTTSDVAGDYVIVELDTSAINAGYTLQSSGGGSSSSSSGSGSSDGGPSGSLSAGGPPSGSSGRPSGGPSGGSSSSSGGPSGSLGSSTLSNQLQVTVTQTGTITTTSGKSYAAASALTTNYKQNVNLVVDDFKQAKFADSSTSDTLMYNLFTPKITAGQKYPLVVFMPDATATSTDPVATLTQGLGAVVWAESTSQQANPTFVLAPQYTGSEKDDKADTVALIKQIIADNAIDPARVYLTGQSAGTIRAIAMLIDQPTMYAGAMLVAGQADSGYTSKLAQLKDQNLWMVCSTGDARALPGMTAIQTAVQGAGVTVTKTAWSATAAVSEQDADAKTAAAASTHIKFTVLSNVVPSGVTDNDVTEHLNTWRVAYSIDEIRAWTLQQKR